MNNSTMSSSPGPTERLELYLDGQEQPAEVLTEGPFHVDLDTTALPNGEHTLRVVRVDAAGRTTEKTIPFAVNNAPEPDITGLEPGAEVAGRIGIDFAPPAPPPLPKRVGISPWWYFVGAVVIFLGAYLFFVLVPAYNILAPSGGKEAAAPVDQALMAVGQKVYGDNCVACHQASGSGMPPSIPALAGNTALGDVNTVLTTISKGSGAMQAFTTLDAQQIAAVATYVRNSWGNSYGGVSVQTATEVTGATAPSQAAAPSAGAQAPSAAGAAPEQPAQPAAPAQPSAPAQPAAPAQPSAEAPARQPAGGAAPSAASGGGEFVEAPAKITASDGTELGTLSLGAKLTAGAQNGGKTEITVDGWSMKGAESVIFLAMGTRVDLASLTDAGQKAVQVSQTKTDDYGTTWSEVKLSGLVDSKSLTGDSQALWQTASDLYASTCSACHALHAPDTYTANQWPGTLKSMVPNTALTPDQVAMITKYLQYHAKGM